MKKITVIMLVLMLIIGVTGTVSAGYRQEIKKLTKNYTSNIEDMIINIQSYTDSEITRETLLDRLKRIELESQGLMQTSMKLYKKAPNKDTHALIVKNMSNMNLAINLTIQNIENMNTNGYESIGKIIDYVVKDMKLVNQKLKN